MSGSPTQEAKLGVVERWISSQAGNASPTPTSTSPKASNPSSPNAGLYRTGTPSFGRSQSLAPHDSTSSLSFNFGSGSGFNSTLTSKSNVSIHFSSNVSSPSLTGFAQGNTERLYEAFNELHGLAQDFQKPFDAPAILVVGHQTDGKSALIEALMGFQFNHVGGGTKTRRPITLHMKYNASCEEPMCYLVSEDNQPKDEDKSLEDIQAYIEAENMRLEKEACQFWAKEIVIKIEYKYCPNLTIIDTPGLIAAAPGRKNRALQVCNWATCFQLVGSLFSAFFGGFELVVGGLDDMHHVGTNVESNDAQARAVEALVRSKMQYKEFIILCLEDCSDWSNATTRRVVMQVDPELSRTVIVSTKLDTKIPQFGRSLDVELFLRPPTLVLDGSILGESPFFTSVPSGRVGTDRDSVYRLNDQFKEAVALREIKDVAALEEKLGRPLLKDERARVGVSRLRCFLEELLQRRYMDSVPLIVPLLDKEYRSITRKLRDMMHELGNLDEMKLKEKGRLFRDSFLAKLSLLLKGTIVAPPERFGETLQDERVHGGAFIGSDGLQIPYKLMPNAGMRLYGGAQYHRAMAEFRFVVGGIKCPPISREEIVNACGVEDIHDGTNYFRTACVIAVAKARDTFEPFLHQLGFRLSHILRRLLPITLYLLQKDGEYLSGHDMFMRRVTTAFHSFAESTERACREKCMEDLLSTTRYVTWSLHNKNRAGLRQFLDSFASGEQPSLNSAAIVGTASQDLTNGLVGNGSKQENKPRPEMKAHHIASNVDSAGGNQTAETRLVDLLDSTLWNRRLAPSSEQIVNALVAQIFQGIRDHFVASAELKFNCFFLMPVVDKFPALLREDLEAAFEDDLDNVFDVAHARRAVEQRKRDLEIELRRLERLKEKFKAIHHHLSGNQPSSPSQKEIADDINVLNINVNERG